MSEKHSLPERVGLLFVHGIGQQKRFEHLTGSVAQIAEIMRQIEAGAYVSVVDRIAGWKFPPGQPDPAGTAPITLTYEAPDRHIEFECYEVWWADLGPHSGVLDVILFWIWGLGQWCAPIYRELDASAIRKTKSQGTATLTRSVSDIVKLPQSVAGNPIQESLVRFLLFCAGLAALFTLVSWTLAKRAFASLLGQAPSPTLIEQYVGDVRTYEERATPGDTSVDDPGCPRRVGIRRRMITEMVAVGSQQFDRWYVLGHSLGSVVAYNGLTEIGHTLPNYLSKEQWQNTPTDLKQDNNCVRRNNIAAMMPARPRWLARHDVVNRPLLFMNLRGFLTYGSPLDKFAAIWPRIVATATDRKIPDWPFRNCTWINLAAPHDIVADWLKRYPGPLFPRDAVPRLVNRATPLDWHYLISHLRYFAGIERCDQKRPAKAEREIVRWLLGNETPDKLREMSIMRRWLLVYPIYSSLVLVLWIMCAALVTAVIGTWVAVSGPHASGYFTLAALTANMAPLLGTSLAIIMFCGLWRWYREDRLNVQNAETDVLAANDEGTKRDSRALIAMLRAQTAASLVMLAASVPIVTFDVIIDWRHELCRQPPSGIVVDWLCTFSDFGLLPAGLRSTVASILAVAIAILLQSLINLFVSPVRTVEQERAQSPAPA